MWLCWIPILTPFINFNKRLQNFLDDLISKEKIEEKDKNKIFTCRQFRYHKQLNDCNEENPTPLDLLVTFDNFKVLSIKFNEVITANIKKLTPDGLVIFKINCTKRITDREEEIIARQTYVILKDIYHEHTHHHENVDMLLVPVKIFADTDVNVNIGIEKIFEQYAEKIIEYHKEIKHKNYYDDELIELFKKAIGEMIYALHFLSLIEENLNEKRRFSIYRKSFESSINSFQNLLNIHEKELSQINLHKINITIILSLSMILLSITSQQVIKKISFLLWPILIIAILIVIFGKRKKFIENVIYFSGVIKDMTQKKLIDFYDKIKEMIKKKLKK